MMSYAKIGLKIRPIMDASRTFDTLNQSYLMKNLSIMKRLPKHIAQLYKELKTISSKLYCTAGSIGFIKKALHHEVTPKFAQKKQEKHVILIF